MSTVIPQLAAALVERWAQLPNVVEFNAEVRRGLPVDGLGVRDMVLVEFDGDPEARENSTFTRAWLDLAMTRQQEDGVIRCTTLSQTGSVDVERMAERAGLLAADCAADLITDITVGGIVWSASVVLGSAQQVKNDRGTAVIVPFTVAYSAPA